MLSLLWKQLLHDLKASWQKSAALGMLLLLGLYFWLPMLTRAFDTGSANAMAAPTPVPAGPLSSPPPSAGPSGPAGGHAEAAEKAAFDWQAASRAHEHDDLLQPAGRTDFDGDPFQVDPAQFPPPVLFAEVEPQRAVPRQDARSQADPRSEAGLSGVVLSSTIVSSSRRAALINSRLYLEGAQVRIDGHSYRLASVEPRRVILHDGTQAFELEIRMPFETDQPTF